MLDTEVKASLDRIRLVWDDTENVLKRAERIRAQVVEPAINELRYAGRRLVDAMHVADTANADQAARRQFDSYVTDCLFRCYCAQHDALDASILYVQRVVREYEQEFGLPLMHRHFPWLSDMKAKLFDADDLIVASRKDRGTRESVYHTLASDHLPHIVADYRRLVSSHDALKALFEEHDKDGRKENGRFWTLVLITVGAALLGAIVASILTVYLTIRFIPPAPSPVASNLSTDAKLGALPLR